MARIESDGRLEFRPGSRASKGRDKRSTTVGNGFSTIFERKVEPPQPLLPEPAPVTTLEEAQELLDDIHQLGDRLTREQTWSALQEYREAVRRFLHSVAAGATDVEQHVSGTNVLNRKRFTLIRSIDQKLERLAAGMLQTQQSQLEMLRRVEEIQGLLVDLFH